jgi:hypothetical protein
LLQAHSSKHSGSSSSMCTAVSTPAALFYRYHAEQPKDQHDCSVILSWHQPPLTPSRQITPVMWYATNYTPQPPWTAIKGGFSLQPPRTAKSRTRVTHPSPISSASTQPRCSGALRPITHSYMKATPSRWWGRRWRPR